MCTEIVRFAFMLCLVFGLFLVYLHATHRVSRHPHHLLPLLVGPPSLLIATYILGVNLFRREALVTTVTELHAMATAA